MKPLYLIIGPSGSGKNYFCSKMHFTIIPSYTTRPKRNNEQDGVEHIFSDKQTFIKHYQDGNAAAFTVYCYNLYWATKDQLENPIYDAYIIDPCGIEYLLQYNHIQRECIIIYIKTNIFKRILRMKKRGDSILQIIKRIFFDSKEFKKMKYIIKKYSNQMLIIAT